MCAKKLKRLLCGLTFGFCKIQDGAFRRRNYFSHLQGSVSDRENQHPFPKEPRMQQSFPAQLLVRTHFGERRPLTRALNAGVDATDVDVTLRDWERRQHSALERSGKGLLVVEEAKKGVVALHHRKSGSLRELA